MVLMNNDLDMNELYHNLFIHYLLNIHMFSNWENGITQLNILKELFICHNIIIDLEYE